MVLTEKSGVLFTTGNSINTILHQYFSIKIDSNTNGNVSEKKKVYIFQKENEVRKRKAVIAKTNIINQNLNLALEGESLLCGNCCQNSERKNIKLEELN